MNLKNYIYFDNAASTAIHPEVIIFLTKNVLQLQGGSDTNHSFGSRTKMLVENARATIAKIINAKPNEIIFTSGGDNANYQVINQVLQNHNIQNIITSPLENDPIIETLQSLNIPVKYIKHLDSGFINYQNLEELLSKNTNSLLYLSHANYETGTLLQVKNVSDLCKKYNAIFHLDAMQTVGKFAIDVKTLQADFITADANKFHGLPGCGFIYCNGENYELKEICRNLKSVEKITNLNINFVSIAAMAKALEIASQDISESYEKTKLLRDYFQSEVEKAELPLEISELENRLPYIVNIKLPEEKYSDLIIEKLDLKGLAIGRCVKLEKLKNQLNPQNIIRLSFSKFTTKDEILRSIDVLKSLVI